MGAGVAFLDYDLDGWTDLLLVGGGNFRESEPIDVAAVWLYRNLGDGTFQLANRETGLADVRCYGMGLAVADVDNDGDPDFLLTSLYENLLFRNDSAPVAGGRRFAEVGGPSGIGRHSDWSTSAAFFDADRDGWVDLFVANYLSWSPELDRECHRNGLKSYCTPEESVGSASRYYHNNGDGTFTERTVEAGFADAIAPALNKALGVAEADVNDDGWPDLYVANDTERDLLYVNRGDGTFDEQGVEMAVAYSAEGKARAGMGADGGVVDETGRTTLFVGNFSRESVGVYRYSGDGYFEARDLASHLAKPTNLTLTFGLFLFDVDLDGDLDLFLANGHIQSYIAEIYPGSTFRQSPQLFLNDGSGVFSQAGLGAVPFTDALVGRGAAYADVDGDGDLDVALTENDGPVRLWRNDGRTGGAVRITLHGAPPDNRDAFGSSVRGRVGDDSIVARVHGGSSYLSHSESVVTLGLGDAPAVENVVVRWPDGSEQMIGRLERGHEVHVYQGRSDVTVRPFRQAS